MKRFLQYIPILAIAITISCHNNKTNKPAAEDKSETDIPTVTPIQEPDSLDQNYSTPITDVSKMPGSVHKALVESNKEIMDILLSTGGDTLAAIDALKAAYHPKGFSYDSTHGIIIFLKRSFNKIDQISLSKEDAGDEAVILSERWFEGKKYDMVTVKIYPRK